MRHSVCSLDYRLGAGPVAAFPGVAEPRDRRLAVNGTLVPMTMTPAPTAHVKAWDNASHAGKGITPRPLVLQGGCT